MSLCVIGCQLRMIGKALFRRYSPVSWGAWMKESQPVSAGGADNARVWVMKHFTGRVVLQYDSADDFVADRVSVVHELPQPFYGTGHVVYGSAIYYHRAGTDLIVRSDQLTKTLITTTIKVKTYNLQAACYNMRQVARKTCNKSCKLR